MSERLGIYAEERETAAHSMAALGPSSADDSWGGGTAVDIGRGCRADETRRPASSIADARSFPPPAWSYGED